MTGQKAFLDYMFEGEEPPTSLPKKALGNLIAILSDTYLNVR